MGQDARKKMKKSRQDSSGGFFWTFLNGLVITLVSAALVIGFSYFIFTSDIFTVKQIKSFNAQDEQMGRSLLGKSIFTVNIQQLHKQLIKDNPEYKNVYIIREFPSTIRIKVQKRRPYAQVKKEKFYLVDREGVVLASGVPEPVPHFIVVEIEDTKICRPGQSIIDPELETALGLVEQMQKHNITQKFSVRSVNATSLDGLYFVVELKDSNSGQARLVKVIVGKDNLDQKLSRFEYVLDEEWKNRLASKNVQYIDLRYKRVYIGPEMAKNFNKK